MKKTVIYRSAYGLPLSKWDQIMSRLWYYTAKEEKLWAKLIYHPIHFIEKAIARLKHD